MLSDSTAAALPAATFWSHALSISPARMLESKVLYMMMAAAIRSCVEEEGPTKSVASEFRLCCGHTSYRAFRTRTEGGRPYSVIV